MPEGRLTASEHDFACAGIDGGAPAGVKRWQGQAASHRLEEDKFETVQ